MKKILLACLLALPVACAKVDPLQLNDIKTDITYQFTRPALNTSFYLRLLSAGPQGELLFKTAPNHVPVTRLREDDEGVYRQKAYQVSERGKLSFYHVAEGLLEELILIHQYASSASQQGNKTILRYSLDMRRAQSLE